MESISIVLCTFNGAAFLDAQMHSLSAQEGVGEIVASDDGSTDATVAILRRHARRDPRIRIFENPTRLGVAGNFEAAIRRANAPWIALSDQDDVWRPDKLARLRAAWDGEACLLHHASLKFHGAVPAVVPAVAGERRKFTGRDVRRCLYRNTVVGHATLVRADVARRLMPFPRDVPYDWWIGAGAALNGAIQYVDEYLVCYRIHATNAYHAIGSRRRRRQEAHGLRLNLIDALAARDELSAATRAWIHDYRARLVAAAQSRRVRPLWRFYRQHAELFFGSERARAGRLRYWRKSLAAAWDAAVNGRRVGDGRDAEAGAREIFEFIGPMPDEEQVAAHR